jgi:predicted phosphodiesterase
MKLIDIALEYRLKYGWDMPTRALARIMLADLPEVFNNIETPRAYLRALEKKSSTVARVKDEVYEQIPDFAKKPRPLNPYSLPKSYEKAQANYKWPKAASEVLLISDLHVPYHSIGAITAALDYAKTNGITGILILGDFLDNHNVSRFEKDPTKRSVIQELNAGRVFLEQLRANFPDAHIAWAYGNHDVRYEHYLRRQAPELFEDPYYHLHQRLGLADLNIEWINDRVVIKLGKLNAAHGHHVVRGVFAPVNPARGAYMKAKDNIVIGHLHNPSHHTEVSMGGRMVGAWSLGCLCQLRPDYSPMTGNAQHGFAHVTIEDGGGFLFRNFKVIEKKKDVHQVYPC